MVFFSTIVFALILLDNVEGAQQEIYRIPAYVFRNADGVCTTKKELQEGHDNVAAAVTTVLSSLVNKNSPCRYEEGWRRIADVNMSDVNQLCPQGLSLYAQPFRLCGRTLSEDSDFCEGTIFSVAGASYSSVCGRIKGYQVNLRYSFGSRPNLEHSYVDGVSLTHGPAGSRQHIWTFAIGYDTINTDSSHCPVNGSELPSFIANDYFCDSGNTPGSTQTDQVYAANPLWDGEGCDGDPYTPPRCYVNDPPWFHKILPSPTTDDIELRICGFSTSRFGDTRLQEIELYVK